VALDLGIPGDLIAGMKCAIIDEIALQSYIQMMQESAVFT
jgi:hypothetical protein